MSKLWGCNLCYKDYANGYPFWLLLLFQSLSFSMKFLTFFFFLLTSDPLSIYLEGLREKNKDIFFKDPLSIFLNIFKIFFFYSLLICFYLFLFYFFKSYTTITIILHYLRSRKQLPSKIPSYHFDKTEQAWEEHIFFIKILKKIQIGEKPNATENCFQ